MNLRFLIAGKESMLLPQECLEFAKYIRRHRIKTQMKPLGYIDTPIQFESLKGTIDHTEVTGTDI